MQKLGSLSPLLGSPASLQCVLKGSEPMAVSWMKDNHELKEAEHVHITYENKTALLHISRVDTKHGGKYSCQAQNQAGSQTCSALLTVKGRFRTGDPNLGSLPRSLSSCNVSFTSDLELLAAVTQSDMLMVLMGGSEQQPGQHSHHT